MKTSKVLLLTLKAPMQQKAMMAGNSRWYGIVSIRIQSPISGRLSSTSSRLPTHIDAIMPQNSSGSSVTTFGPGVMPWMIIAPIISAITGFDGMPSVSIGMKEVCAPALLANSGAATPSIAPLPNSALLGEIFFSME